jgi:hypothetical protein
MTFLAPNEVIASNLTQEVDDYLRAGVSMRLVAPWSPEANDVNYAQFRKSRAEWQTMGAQLGKTYNDSDYESYAMKIQAALKRGSMAEVKKLTDEQEMRRKELRAKALEQLGANGSATRAALAKLYAKLDGVPFTNRVERQKAFREVAAHLGEVRYVDDRPEPKSNSYSAYGGMISMHGLLCEVRWASFAHPQGLVSLTKWLCDKGCSQMKYELMGGGRNIEDAEEDLEPL